MDTDVCFIYFQIPMLLTEIRSSKLSLATFARDDCIQMIAIISNITENSISYQSQ